MHLLRYLETNWLSCVFRQRSGLIEFRRLFVFELPQQDRVDIILERGMESMTFGLFLIGPELDPSVDERVTDRIGDIVAHEPGEKRRCLLFLLS